MRKLIILVCILVLGFASSSYGVATKMYGRTTLTGGTKSVDNIAWANLNDGDLCIAVLDTDTIYYYRFESTSPAATETDAPWVIEPTDAGANDGDWLLINSFVFNRVAEPTSSWRDSGPTDDDINAQIYVNCTTEGTTAEDCDVQIKAQIDGSLDAFIIHDGDSAVVLDDGIDSTVQVGTVKSPTTPRLYSATYTAAETLETEECYNSTIYISNATTITLPPMAYGMKITFITLTAHAISIDANGADDTDLDGLGGIGVGEKSTSQSTAGEVIVYTYMDVDGWKATSDGWTDGGA